MIFLQSENLTSIGHAPSNKRSFIRGTQKKSTGCVGNPNPRAVLATGDNAIMSALQILR